SHLNHLNTIEVIEVDELGTSSGRHLNVQGGMGGDEVKDVEVNEAADVLPTTRHKLMSASSSHHQITSPLVVLDGDARAEPTQPTNPQSGRSRVQSTPRSNPQSSKAAIARPTRWLNDLDDNTVGQPIAPSHAQHSETIARATLLSTPPDGDART